MRASILTLSLGAVALISALPIAKPGTGSLIPRLDLVGGTAATYTVGTGTDTRGLSSRAIEQETRGLVSDGAKSRDLVKDAFGRGAYGIDAARPVDSSPNSTE
ncbi:hypothetical protein ONS95_006811 [Cadophora gregata]|uniref:uncharacterized protein n=1 Tax=Cadophora gregata TaxID=51156 RepID=UPI0026DCC315|nr:uncharacterized protein ONS95_006811 [Cadophora gregata]KAK0101651.1 hypothetical protein ONS95_006811 [Cadophora gregata]